MQQNDLLYSKNALDVKAQFYNKRAIVYVEGVDDVPFWGEYFDSADYEVQEVGGCENLMQYIAKIRDGVTSFMTIQTLSMINLNLRYSFALMVIL